eukprot:3665916-Amphidinium_carterae.1
MRTRGQRAADKIQPFSNYYLKQRHTLLGHLLRSDSNSLPFSSLFTPDLVPLADSHTRRVGRPRAT